MIGKTHASDGSAPSALDGYEVLGLRGRDALQFLQAQCMNDVLALADRQWQWNGVLSAKGRLLALFALLRMDPESFLCVLPDVEATGLQAHFLRYRFRARVEITPRDDLRASGQLAAGAARGAVAEPLADGGLALDMGGARPRTLLLSPRPGRADAAAAAAWRREDLLHGLPRLPADQLDAWTPQMLSLERLQAYSVKKGCYPGQEIVARTHFLGQAKRALHLLEATSEVVAGQPVGDGGRALGTVVSTAPAGAQGPCIALAVLASADGEALQVGEVPARWLPLADGLAR